MCACVCGARGLRESRVNDLETGLDDADCDGHLWLQQHSWGICNGRNERLEVGACEGEEEGKVGLYSSLPGRSQAGGYARVRYEQGSVLGQKENKGTYKGSPR